MKAARPRSWMWDSSTIKSLRSTTLDTSVQVEHLTPAFSLLLCLHCGAYVQIHPYPVHVCVLRASCLRVNTLWWGVFSVGPWSLQSPTDQHWYERTAAEVTRPRETQTSEFKARVIMTEDASPRQCSLCPIVYYSIPQEKTKEHKDPLKTWASYKDLFYSWFTKS